jgi:Undecaprenyl-phosphate galactose phosphotransferase WbaP
MRRYEQMTEKFCCSCLRPLILMAADFTAIVVVCSVLNLFFLLVLDTKLISWSVVVRSGLFFVFTAEFSRLYHESILAPGLIPPPQEELRRIFLIFFGLLTIRMFYFREFPLLAKHFGGGDPVFIPLKFFLVFGMLPFLYGGVIFFRWLARNWMFRKEIGVVPVVILGAGTTGRVVARVLKKSKHFGMKPVGFFDDDPRKQGGQIHGLPVLGTLADYHENQESFPGAVPVLCLPIFALLRWGKRAFFQNQRAYIASSDNFFPATGAGIYDLHGLTVLGLKNDLNISFNLHAQRLLNLLIAVPVVIVFMLPMAVIAVLIKLTSPGPVIYFARRLGQGGREITIPKFRTMYRDAEARLAELLERSPELRREWDEHFKLKEDPRITPLGAFLRKTSLDELPQLFSVLKGDMNLVGPRPIVTAEIPRFGDSYEFISRVKPGLTGMWQVSGRSETTYEERVFLETYYIRNWSLWLDLYILMKTALEVALCRGAY